MNELAGKPLRYLIGLKKDAGELGAITEPGYETTVLPIGVGVGYVNRRQEEGPRKPGVSYIDPPDDIEQEYGEPAPTFGTDFFWQNIDSQCERLQALGFKHIEIDNTDVDTIQQTLELYDHVAAMGFGIMAKNVGDIRLLAHPFIVGHIVEHGDGVTAQRLDQLRKNAGKPVQPIRVVTYGDELPWAERVAHDAATMTDFGVTHSAIGEYKSVTHILKPRAPEREAMAWRVAKSLNTILAQVNTAYPNRDISSDGTIGDASHQASASDHNPDDEGVVRARDITHDPSNGFDSYRFAEDLRINKDPRISYVISNGRIFSSSTAPWQWRKYSGSNPHDHHVHISVVKNDSLADSTKPWTFSLAFTPPVGPEWASGKGSWYSQYDGKFHWRDSGDAPRSNALGVPDSVQGVSFLDKSRLGKWFEVKAPNGTTLIMQQTDIGPAAWTGKKIDISAVAAERFGYSPNNFPTGSVWSWRPIETPKVVAGLTPQQQAVAYQEYLDPNTKTRSTKWVQESLNKLGANLNVDGLWGPRTSNALREFQKKAGIGADGLFGPVSQDAIEKALAKL